MNPMCKDNKCLFSSTQESIHGKFQTVTTEVREGKGLWEKCETCQLVINRNGVPKKEVDSFYNSTYVEENSYTRGELLTAKEHFDARIDSLRPIASFLAPFLKPYFNIFELGAATGELLYLMKDQVQSCSANELNQLYGSFIVEHLGIPSSSEDYLQQEMPHKMDLILSVNTIDHLANPRLALNKMNADLTNGGMLYIEVPNDNQALKTYLPAPQRKAFEAFMYQKAHYYSFSEETITRLLENTGFSLIEATSRHDYTIHNYLNWYYLGQPQKRIQSAMNDTDIHYGDSSFENEMNELFKRTNDAFKQIISSNFAGETICVIARKT